MKKEKTLVLSFGDGRSSSSQVRRRLRRALYTSIVGVVDRLCGREISAGWARQRRSSRGSSGTMRHAPTGSCLPGDPTHAVGRSPSRCSAGQRTKDRRATACRPTPRGAPKHLPARLAARAEVPAAGCCFPGSSYRGRKKLDHGRED